MWVSHNVKCVLVSESVHAFNTFCFVTCSPEVHAVCGGLFGTAAICLLPDATEREHLRAAQQAHTGSVRLQRLVQQQWLCARAPPSSSAPTQTEAAGELHMLYTLPLVLFSSHRNLLSYWTCKHSTYCTHKHSTHFELRTILMNLYYYPLTDRTNINSDATLCSCFTLTKWTFLKPGRSTLRQYRKFSIW